MYWFVDSANTWYVLLGTVALGFGAACWVNRRPKYLLGAAVAAVFILFVWLLTRAVVTDRKQLELNIHAMADAVMSGKKDVLLKHFANDFEFQEHRREDVADGAIRGAMLYGVSEIAISSFDVEELTDRSARVYFRARIDHREDTPYLIGCRALFNKDSGQWKLKGATFYNPLVNQNQSIRIPLP